MFCREECVEQFSIVFSSEVFEKVLYESILVSPSEPISLIDLHLLNSHKVIYNIQYFLVFKGDPNLELLFTVKNFVYFLR